MSEEILHIDNVKFFFPDPSGKGSREALSIPQLVVRRGEFLSLTGPSGSGKSTLIHLIAGFLTPSEGTILKNGNPISGSGPDRIVVFQKHALFPWLTVFDNVVYGLRRTRLSRTEQKVRVLETLNMIGLSDFAHAYPATLSGGMCQRVALARALVLRPDILLLDEPFASLDATNRLRLQEELLALWESHHWTVIQVTHQLDEAIYMADRVAVIFPPPRGMGFLLDIDIPRPRSPDDPAVTAISRRLAQALIPPSL